MSREIRSISLGLTVDKWEHWPADRAREADECTEEDCHSYGDHAAHLLADAVYEAAAAWHAANPGLLACEPG